MKKLGLRIGDIIIFTLCLSGLLWSYGLFGSRFMNGSTDKLIVKIVSFDNEWIYPLDNDMELEIEGPLGLTHVHISSGKVSISQSPCKNKVCILTGEVSSINSWIACLPNKIFVQIESSKKNEGIDETSF